MRVLRSSTRINVCVRDYKGYTHTRPGLKYTWGVILDVLKLELLIIHLDLVAKG